MNYAQIYKRIIDNAKTRKTNGYTEGHHIVPKSLGGSDDKSNLVNLTAKEHYVCHLLLTKMYPYNSQQWHKMIKALTMMQAKSSNHTRYTGKLHERYREHFSFVQSASQSGKGNSNYGTMWIYHTETYEHKKILKTDPIPDNWLKGRKTKKLAHCKHCNTEFLVKTKEQYCSDKCRKIQSQTADYYGREEEYKKLLAVHKSMNKTLKVMGYPGAVSHWYKWASSIK